MVVAVRLLSSMELERGDTFKSVTTPKKDRVRTGKACPQSRNRTTPPANFQHAQQKQKNVRRHVVKPEDSDKGEM